MDNNLFGKIPQMFNGFRVVESTMAMETVPVRRHKQTRAKSDSYHSRIQKKWNKRFGFKQVPGIYMIDTSKLTFGGLNGGEKVIMAHPEMAARLKELSSLSPTVEEAGKGMKAFGKACGNAGFSVDRFKDVMVKHPGVIDLDGCA